MHRKAFLYLTAPIYPFFIFYSWSMAKKYIWSLPEKNMHVVLCYMCRDITIGATPHNNNNKKYIPSQVRQYKCSIIVLSREPKKYQSFEFRCYLLLLKKGFNKVTGYTEPHHRLPAEGGCTRRLICGETRTKRGAFFWRFSCSLSGNTNNNVISGGGNIHKR